jgi:hypothetical protein
MVSRSHHSQVIHIPDLSDDKSGRGSFALQVLSTTHRFPGHLREQNPIFGWSKTTEYKVATTCFRLYPRLSRGSTPHIGAALWIYVDAVDIKKQLAITP